MRLSLIILALASLLPPTDTIAQTGFGPGTRPEVLAKTYFDDDLSKCPEHEIRCVWFSEDQVTLAPMMTVDLKERKVTSLRHAHNWARGGLEDRKLTLWQINALKEAVRELPESSLKPVYEKCIHISYWVDGSLRIRTYSKSSAPLEVRRIYEIGGAETAFTYTKTKKP